MSDLNWSPKRWMSCADSLSSKLPSFYIGFAGGPSHNQVVFYHADTCWHFQKALDFSIFDKCWQLWRSLTTKKLKNETINRRVQSGIITKSDFFQANIGCQQDYKACQHVWTATRTHIAYTINHLKISYKIYINWLKNIII